VLGLSVFKKTGYPTGIETGTRVPVWKLLGSCHLQILLHSNTLRSCLSVLQCKMTLSITFYEILVTLFVSDLISNIFKGKISLSDLANS